MALYYLFDLDGTLFFTDELNNASYNYALESMGYPRIEGEGRVTRDTVVRKYPLISSGEMQRMVEIKQLHFCRHIEEAVDNRPVITMLRCLGKQRCALWTAADENRVRCLLRSRNLANCYCSIMYSDKRDIPGSLERACAQLSCGKDEIVVVEGDARVAEEVREFGFGSLIYLSV